MASHEQAGGISDSPSVLDGNNVPTSAPPTLYVSNDDDFEVIEAPEMEVATPGYTTSSGLPTASQPPAAGSHTSAPPQLVEGTPVGGTQSLTDNTPGAAIAGLTAAATLPIATATAVPIAVTPIAEVATEVASSVQALADIARSTSQAVAEVNEASGMLEQTAHHKESDLLPRLGRGPDVALPYSSVVGQSDVALIEVPRKAPKPAVPPPDGEAVMEGSRVKTGDNSITTTGITATLVQDIVGKSNPDDANFFQVFRSRLIGLDNCFIADNHSIGVQSQLYANDVGGRLSNGVPVMSNVFLTFPQPIPAERRHTLTVHTGPSRVVSTIDPALLAPFMTGGNVSERFVVSAIQPKLAMASVQAARFLSEYITSSVEVCDNYVMYAKMFYQAMVLDIVARLGLNIAVDAFPAGNDPNFINLDDPNLNYLNIANPIVRGDIMFVHRLDYDATDLQALMWLAKPGTRASAAGGVQIPHACYVAWPAIPITVLHHGGPPDIPVVEDLTSDYLYSFIAKLASSRSEWTAALRGLYLAADLIGVRYSHDADVEGGAYHFIMSNLSYHSPVLPAPRDYNVLIRILNIRPVTDANLEVEITSFTSATATKRVNMLSVYTSTLSTLATTLLYDFNLTHYLLGRWGTGEAIGSTSVRVIRLLNQPQQAGVGEAPFLRQIKHLFPTFVAANVPDLLYPNLHWLGNQGGSPNAQVAYFGQGANRPPRLVTPLCIDEWLAVRPMEWGISGPNTTIDIRADFAEVSHILNRGWRARRGSSLYNQRMESDSPMVIVVYGVQILNAMANDQRWGEPRPITYATSEWSPGHGNDWTAPIQVPGRQGNYMPALHCWEPCTLMSYDFLGEQVLAPALGGAGGLFPIEMSYFSHWGGAAQTMVGFAIPQDLPSRDVGPMLKSLSLAGMFSGAPVPTETPTTTVVDPT